MEVPTTDAATRLYFFFFCCLFPSTAKSWHQPQLQQQLKTGRLKTKKRLRQIEREREKEIPRAYKSAQRTSVCVCDRILPKPKEHRTMNNRREWKITMKVGQSW